MAPAPASGSMGSGTQAPPSQMRPLPQSALVRQATHAEPTQYGVEGVSVAHWLSSEQVLQIPPEQMGFAAGHCELNVHSTHWFAEQIFVGSVQSVFSAHCTHWFAEHTPVGALQSVFSAHCTHCPPTQAGVAPVHC